MTFDNQSDACALLTRYNASNRHDAQQRKIEHREKALERFKRLPIASARSSRQTIVLVLSRRGEIWHAKRRRRAKHHHLRHFGAKGRTRRATQMEME